METDQTPEQPVTADAAAATGAPPPLAPYLVRREPILDPNQSLVGYRIRILWTDVDDATAAPEDAAHDDGIATLACARAHGNQAMFAGAPHWISTTTALLDSPGALSLPVRRLYLEFPETLEITPERIRTLQQLAHGGAKFSIRADWAARPEYEALLPFCKAVRFDPAHSTQAEIFRQSLPHKQAGRLLVGVRVPSKAALDNFLLLGFQYFEGGWPRDPVAAGTLSPRQKTLLRLTTQIMGDSEIPEIQASLEQDPELVQALLDMVNTPAYGLGREVESLNQAIMLLGRRQLQRWIQILMYTETGRPAGYVSPTLIQASARAHLMEALSTLRHPEQNTRAEAAFTTGVLSSMGQLFHRPTAELLQNIQVDVPIREALLRRQGALAADLRLAVLLFPAPGEAIEAPGPLLGQLGVTADQLQPLAQDAFTWAHGITQAAP